MSPTMRRQRRWWFSAFLAALFAALPAHVHAQAKAKPSSCVAAPGVLLAHNDAGWKAVGAGTPAPAETRLVALFDATLRSPNGSVEARLMADVGQRGPFAILESAVILHDDPVHDLALSPLRGLTVLTNVKGKGPATVRLSFRAETVVLTLQKPGAKVALEIFGRHTPGAPQLDPKHDEPVFNLFFITLAGEALVTHGDKTLTLHAPPGPAILTWDSLLRQPEVQRLEKLPGYIQAAKVDDRKALEDTCAWAVKLADQPPARVMAQGAASASAIERKAAVTAMGALDELPALLDVLASATHPDAREHAVLVLRQWLGRAPGQTAKLNATLIKADYTPIQARNVLQLLYGFTAEQRRNPDTYSVLIDGLNNSRPALRGLAHWHLVRLAPAGKGIVYDALAPETDRERAAKAWRALVPDGQLPPAPKVTIAP